MTEFFEFVKLVGVPAAITFFVLWRVEARLAELIREIRTLHERVGEIVAVNTKRLTEVERRLTMLEEER